MSTLHIVSKQGEPLELCLRVLLEKDCILLIEEGVYSLYSHTDRLMKRPHRVPLYALESDMYARGVIQPDALQLIMVDYLGFVELTTVCKKTISWF